jgi:hypothetical protein
VPAQDEDDRRAVHAMFFEEDCGFRLTGFGVYSRAENVLSEKSRWITCVVR